jgi:hypothetical protein
MVLKHERKTLGHAIVFLLVMVASPAISNDFGILTRMLYAAFLAEQGVAVCIVADPAFASETSGPMGYMRDYAQHVKAEVTAGLNETETRSLLKSAAGLAKAEALQALRSLRTEGTLQSGAKRSSSHSCGRLLIRMTTTTPRSISYSKKQRMIDKQRATSCVTLHLLYQLGFDPSDNVRFRHSSHGEHYRLGGLDSVKDASCARTGEAGASHP